jgi:hypothetical protein
MDLYDPSRDLVLIGADLFCGSSDVNGERSDEGNGGACWGVLGALGDLGVIKELVSASVYLNRLERLHRENCRDWTQQEKAGLC